MYAFDIIDDPGSIEQYQPEWDRLFDSGSYEASLSLDWTRALLKTHRNGDRFSLVILKDGDEIAGIVPLCIRTVKKQGISLLTMIPAAEYFSSHSDLLLKNSSEKLVAAIWQAILSIEHRWDVFRINRFIEDNPLLESITSVLENKVGCKYDVKKAEPSFFIELPDNYQGFLNQRSANFRYQIRKACRKISKAGDISFLRTSDFDSFDRAYELIMSIEQKSWKQKHGTAISATPKQREFYRELGRRAFRRNWIRFCFLCLDQQPIAFEMGLAKSGKYYGVHGSYDDKFRKWNPGVVLLSRFIEELIADKIREYDWFGEPFAWQARWTRKYRWHKSLLVYNNTPKALLFRFFNRLKNMAVKQPHDQVVLRNPRDVKPIQ